MLDAAPLPTGPAWEFISHDVLCPLCEYNLRGLSEPRCPECGHRFEWEDVTDPNTRVHPYLFEHHPERNIRSFFRTLWGTLRPVKFWRSVSPMQPSRPGRLAVYWVITSVLVFLAFFGEWARAIVAMWDFNATIFYSPYNTNSGPPTTPFSWKNLWFTAGMAWRSDHLLNWLCYIAIFWPFWRYLTLLALLIFRDSLRRAKIKRFHIDRCLVYSLDVGAWLGLMLAAVLICSIWTEWIKAKTENQTVMLAAGAVIAIVTTRLWLAYRLYLRFDHAFWVIVSSQVMVFLLVMNLIVVWYHLAGPPEPGDLFY